MDARNLAGQQIGNFELRQLLGEGAMGVVYLGIDVHLQRPVGIKMMHTHIAQQSDFRERFRHEARAIAQLGHPHIINIHGFFEDNEYLYFVMEYVPCGSLRGYLKERTASGNLLSIHEVLTLVKQVASALDYAHLQNMIHRDVKPGNVLLRSVPNVNTGEIEFSAVLSDFGLVKLAESAGFHTQPDSVVGTLPYMAPELFEGDKIDGRVDLYALGIMFYELAVGQLPFRPKSIAEASRMHISSKPPSPSTLRGEIPRELEAIISKAIEKKRDKRFQRGLELIEAIQAIQDEQRDIITEIDEPLSQQGRLDSLQTYIASMTPPAWGLTAVHRPQTLDHDRIVVSKGQGETIDFIPLTQVSTSVGRDPDADVVLDSPKISRVHAYITRTDTGEYTIRDNNSTNGTYLGTARLLSNVPEPWAHDQVVGVGPYYLQLQKAQQPIGVSGKPRDTQSDRPIETVVDRATRLQAREGVSIFTQSGDVPIEVQLDPGNTLIEAGQQAGAELQVVNRSHVVQHCKLRIEGIPVSWRTLPDYDLQLLPGERNVFPIHFHPSRDWTSTAGTHQFTLYLQAVSPAQEMAYGTGTISIQPFHNFSIDLMPERVRQSGNVTLTVANHGNSVEQFTIQTRDREAAIQFTPRETQIIVPPGQRGKVEFQIELRDDFELEAQEVLPFEIRVSSQQGTKQSASGELIAKGRTSSNLMFTIIDPVGNRHHFSLESDRIAIDLIKRLQVDLNLDLRRNYRLANAKTGQPMLPGQTLADIGIQEGGILWLQEDATPEPVPVSQPYAGLQSYTVIDPSEDSHKISLRSDTLVVDLIKQLPQMLKLRSSADVSYVICDGKTGTPLLPGQTLADAGMAQGGVIWLQAQTTEQETVAPQYFAYTVIDLQGIQHGMNLRPDTFVKEALKDLRKSLKLPSGNYYLSDADTGGALLPEQTLAGAGLPAGGVLLLKAQQLTTEKVPVSQQFTYTVITPKNKRHKLKLSPDVLIYDLLAEYSGRFKLKGKYRYFAYNGKTGTQMMPGQTLADAGLAEGGLIYVRVDPTSVMVDEGPGLLMRILSLPWLLLKLSFALVVGIARAVVAVVVAVFMAIYWVFATIFNGIAWTISTIFAGAIWATQVIILAILIFAALALFLLVLAVLGSS